MLKLINCKSCNNEIAHNAKSCPSCGAKNKKPFYKRGWFIVLVIIIILGAIGESENNDTIGVEQVESKDVKLASYESVKSQAISMLEKGFGNDGEILVYEENEIILFSLPSINGIAELILAINSGVADDESTKSYERMKESYIGLSESLYDLGQTCGKKFALGLQDDRNPDKSLLTILNGVVIYEEGKY